VLKLLYQISDLIWLHQLATDSIVPSNIEHELQAKVAQPLRMQGV
jgi:hypothetical protein